MFSTPVFAIIFWVLFLPSLWITGSLAGHSLSEKKSLWSGFVKLGLGTGVYGYFLILTASFGWLNREVVWLFIAITFILGTKKIKEVFSWLSSVFRFFYEAKDTFSRICQVLLVGTVIVTGLFCFLPEISNDALGIHLYLAKLFVKNKSIAPSYYDIVSYRSVLMSVLYSTGIVFRNVAISKLFHWLSGLLLMGAVSVKINEITKNKKIALFSALMVWLTPTLMNQITTTYIDAGVTLFIFLGYCLILNGLKDFKASDFFYGGILIGLSVSIRSLSLVYICVFMIMLGIQLIIKKGKRNIITAGICLVLGALLSSGYWFLRDWIFTGNPFYPYLGSLFGDKEFNYLSTLYFEDMGLPKSFTSFLMTPWNITMKPQYFDYHHWIGPFYLCVLPAVLYAGVKIKETRIHIQFIIFSIIFWYFTGPNARYLFPVLMIYLLAAAVGLNDLSKKLEGVWTGLSKILALSLSAFLLVLSIHHFRYQFKPILRTWNAGEYLEKTERSISVAEWVNRNLPESAKILDLDEPHLFYFDREMLLDLEFNLRSHYQQINTPEEMLQYLKQKGITHILDTEIRPGDEPPGYDISHRPIDKILKDGHFSQPMARIPSSNTIDRHCQYVIYKLT